MRPEQNRLRIAFIAGTLGQGGAEKQLTLMTGALVDAGAAAEVFALSGGEFNQQCLADSGVPCCIPAKSPLPPVRLLRIVQQVRRFRPHVLQAGHSFVNIYAALAARSIGCLSIGALRGSLHGCHASNGRWTRLQLAAPDALVANSQRAVREVADAGLLREDRIWHVPNALAPQDFASAAAEGRAPVALFAARLIRSKRLNVFLSALAAARIQEPSLRGVVAGDGPERAEGERLARQLRLLPDGVRFTGELPNLRAVLREASMLVFCSDDDEGTPNVLLEAMAAGVPVICTPAGDAASVAGEDAALHVPFRDPAAVADRMLRLMRCPEEARRRGAAGLARAEANHSVSSLADRLLHVYRQAARMAAKPSIPDLSPHSGQRTVMDHA